MKTSRFTLGTLSALTLAGLTLTAQPGHAVVLEQKWRAGTQINYDVAMQGNAILVVDSPNFPLANMPLPIKLNGKGELVLDTRSVDANGTGTVLPRLAPFNVNAEAFNQQFEVRLTPTALDVVWNGQRAGGGALPPMPALQISRLGKLEGVVPPATQAPGANGAPNANAAPNANGRPRNDPFSAVLQGNMFQNAMLQMFPAFWPGRDIAEGETWTVDVAQPPALNGAAPANPAPAEAANAAPLGQFKLTLGAQEAVGQRQARRVAVEGSLKYVAPKPANAGANAAANQPVGGAANGVDNVQQSMKGTLWFDPELGQVIRAELDVQAGAKGSGINVNMGQPNGGEQGNGAAAQGQGGNGTSMDFTGTVQLQLKNVTETPTPAQ